MKLIGLLMAALSLVTPVATETPQPDNSGVLAPRQFLVTTAQGSGLARYYGNMPLEGDGNAKRAIIMVHGVLRDADYYYDTAMDTIRDANAPDTIVIAPQFVERADLEGHNVPANTLYWNGKWPGGSPAIAPAPISTYAVFDAIIARLADHRAFPKMREIVLAGHSAGGQIVQRYAVVGNAASLDPGARMPVHLVVANPSSYLYFSDDRPVPQKNCPDFDQWRYGLAAAPAYVTGDAKTLEARYVRRHVTYLLGTADTNPHESDLDRSCGGESQGAFRFVRGKNYIAYIKRRHPEGTKQDYAFVRGVPHDNRRMFRSQCGLGVLFNRSLASCAAHGRV